MVGGSRFAPNDEGERLRYAGYAIFRRTGEAMTIRARLDRLLADPTDPAAGSGRDRAVVFCGDLNDEPQAATTQIVAGRSGSQIALVPGPDTELKPGSGFTRPDQDDGFRLWNLAPLLPEGQRFTRVFKGRGELIDHIFASHRLVNPANLPAVETVRNPAPLPSMGDDPNSRRNRRLGPCRPLRHLRRVSLLAGPSSSAAPRWSRRDPYGSSPGHAHRSLHVRDRGVDEAAGLPKCRGGALTADVQQPVVGVVLDSEQPVEVARHRLPIRGDLGEHRERLPVVLAARPTPKGSAASRVGRGDTGEARERGGNARGRQHVLLCTHQLGDLEESPRLAEPRAGLLHPARLGPAGLSRAHRSAPATGSRRRTARRSGPVSVMASRSHSSTSGSRARRCSASRGRSTWSG